jgi:hypothetical protein
VLGILQLADERECENGLAHRLGFDKFEFVKLLLRNRAKIVYCTRLKQAQTEEDREAVRAEMRADVAGGGAAILEALEKTQTAKDWEADRTGQFQSRVRKEAKALGAGAKAGAFLPCVAVALPPSSAASSLLCRADRSDALCMRDHRSPLHAAVSHFAALLSPWSLCSQCTHC